MIKLIVGVKGTGKTKALIEDVNKATETSKGSVVCLECGKDLGYEIKPQARLVDVKEFGINSGDAIYGFVSGICAANYDVTDLFVEHALRICGGDINEFEKFVTKLDKVLDKSINCVMIASIDSEKLPEALKKYVIAG